VRKTKLQIYEEELDESYNILEHQKMEQQILKELNDYTNLKLIGDSIHSWKQRVNILEKLIDNIKNPQQILHEECFPIILEIR